MLLTLLCRLYKNTKHTKTDFSKLWTFMMGPPKQRKLTKHLVLVRKQIKLV